MKCRMNEESSSFDNAQFPHPLELLVYLNFTLVSSVSDKAKTSLPP